MQRGTEHATIVSSIGMVHGATIISIVTTAFFNYYLMSLSFCNIIHNLYVSLLFKVCTLMVVVLLAKKRSLVNR